MAIGGGALGIGVRPVHVVVKPKKGLHFCSNFSDILLILVQGHLIVVPDHDLQSCEDVLES